MGDKEKNIIYTAQDIEQYLEGKLTPQQMHAMEKAALDDEFLAEAMEGYGTVSSAEWNKELTAIKDKFENTNHTAKVVALPRRNNNWWKAAAAILLLGGGAVTSYLLINKKDNPAIAQIEKTAPVVSADTAVIAADNEVAVLTEKPAAELKTEQKRKIIAVNKNTATALATDVVGFDSSFVYTPKAISAAADKITKPAQQSDAEKSKEIASTTNAAPSQGYNNTANEPVYDKRNIANQTESYKVVTDNRGVISRDRQQQFFNQNFKAQVVGPDNTPLPFSNITVKNENFGTYADIKGNFNLVSSDSLITVEVKSVGYQPKQFVLKSNVPQNTIVLTEEDIDSKKRTVVGNANAMAKTKAVSRRATLLKDSVVNVEPADGWDNYNTYVNNNIEIPDDILKKNIHGQVEISFDVKPNGTIANIKIDKSLCNDCDEVAKRLIEQGPQWKVKKGKKGKGKITVQF